MDKIGYEFEALMPISDSKLYSDLEKLFGDDVKKIKITSDISIERSQQTPAREGWFKREIITPPQSKTKAYKVLLDIQHYLTDIGAVTNASTGVHVNISSRNMNKLDPMTLIAIIDEHKLTNLFHRLENPYCVPWYVYFTRLNNHIKREKKKIDVKAELIYNGIALVNSYSTNDLIIDTAIYARKLRSFYAKLTTINVSKLMQGYVEFRMMGGKDYHEKELLLIVKELMESVKFATSGRNKKVIEEYFSQY